MWLSHESKAEGVLWTNPCGAISFGPDVYDQYQAAFSELQEQWYAAFPEVDEQPRWYAHPNPPAALAYPPGFLKRDLDVVTLIAASSPDTDGYFWANDRVIIDIDSYEKLEEALRQIADPVDMLILSGECLQVPGDACGLCWRELNEVGFEAATLPPRVAALIRDKIKPTGLFVLGPCHAGENPELVQQLADLVERPVAGALGVCRGVREDLLAEEGVYWTLGGFAEGGAYTLREPTNRADV